MFRIWGVTQARPAWTPFLASRDEWCLLGPISACQRSTMTLVFAERISLEIASSGQGNEQIPAVLRVESSDLTTLGEWTRGRITPHRVALGSRIVMLLAEFVAG